jgi:hypothetical protein
MRRSLFSLLALSLVVVVVGITPALGQNLLQDGLLDTGTAGGGGQPGTNAFWTLVNTGNATAAQYQGGFANSQAPGGLGMWYRAFLGTPAAPVSSTLSQSVVAPAAGTYVLTFDRIVEQNFTADAMTATLSSSGGPTISADLLADRIPAGSSYTGGGFVNIGSATPPYDIVETLTLAGVNAGDTLTVSVTMTNGRDAGANPQSAVIDNFVLVPEPGSLALVGCVLVLARRRARR